MIMVFFVENVIKNRLVIPKVSLLPNSDFAEKVQCPINSGQSNTRIFPANPLIQILCGNVIRFKKGSEYNLTLLGQLQVFLGQMVL